MGGVGSGSTQENKPPASHSWWLIFLQVVFKLLKGSVMNRHMINELKEAEMKNPLDKKKLNNRKNWWALRYGVETLFLPLSQEPFNDLAIPTKKRPKESKSNQFLP